MAFAMNLKTRLFGKPWEQRDPSERAQAVSDSSDSELIRELPRLAREDESATVRLAAFKRLDSEPWWLEARLSDTDPEIRAAADRYLVRQTQQQASAKTLPERLQWLRRIESSETLRLLARKAVERELRMAALERVSSQGFLGDCYVEENDDELADNILQRIDQRSTLERLQERLRKTSKQRARQVARRLADLSAASGADDPDHQAALTLVGQIEALARGGGKGNRPEQLQGLKAQWREIRQPDPSLRRRFEGAESIVQASIDRPAPTAPSEPAESIGASPTVSSELEQTAERIRQTLRQARKKLNPGELLAAWDRAWNHIATPGQADLDLKSEMLPILRELQAQADFKAQQKKAADARNKDDGESAKDLNDRIDQLAEVLDTGDIAQAHEQLGALKSEFDKMPKQVRSQAVAGRLQRMDGRLKEMRNWQHWSNNQHRDELIEQIEGLAGSGQHPDAITATLKQAREEWQRLEKLERIPGERRRYAAPSGQWRRFQAACKNAFESAKPFFEKRNEVQEENLNQLSQFIEIGMKQAEDPDSDSKALLGVQRAARLAIRRLDDLPPRSRGKSASQLRELMDRISARLDQLFGAVEETKRQLIAEARELAEEKDLKLAADKAKALQARWQKAGSGRRKIEQKLWQEFREPIDPLFEKLKGERKQQQQAEKAVLDELKGLCQQAEALSQCDDHELDAAKAQMGELLAQWGQHGGQAGKLQQRFEKARASFRNRLEQRSRKAELDARARIDQLADLIQDIWTRRQQQGTEGLEALLPASQDDDDALAVELLDKARRLALADPADADLATRAADSQAQARLIVVEMEFLSGLDSPDADRDLRMDYQVKRLARRMSEGTQLPALEEELAQLQKRWLDSLPHPPEAHGALKQRYRRSLEILLKMSGQ
jgi:DNA repair protein SbcC/Rad50